MKKLVLVSAMLFCTFLSTSAQEISTHAIGIRFGDNAGFGGEVSYQHKLTSNKRYELDLGYRDHTDYSAFKLTGMYQWVWNVDQGFNWYAGFGAGIGSWSYNSGVVTDNKDGLFINVDGNIGIEYNFEAPILISLDFRPEIGVVGDYGKDTDIDLALSLRYQF
ncbi:hypothetical protein [Lutibacter sp.]